MRPSSAVRSAFARGLAPRAVPTARAGSAAWRRHAPRGHADPGAARGAGTRGRRARSRLLHRPGAQGADHARGRTHPGPAPQLPRLGRCHPDAAAPIASYTQAHGLGVSVMDYSPPALSLGPAASRATSTPPTIGSYDRWAITLRLRRARAGRARSAPMAKGSEAIAPDWSARRGAQRRSAPSRPRRPTRRTSTAPMRTPASAGSASIPPSPATTRPTTRWAGRASGSTLINWLFDSLDTRMVAPGQGYARLRSAFTDLLNDRWYALLVTTKYLGGATTARDHRGDPGARPAFVTVPAARQREALAFIAEAGFGEKAYRFRPELLSQLGPDRWRHWGSSPGADGRIDFPLHDWAMAQQGCAAGPAARSRGAGPDPRRGAPRHGRRADRRPARAVRHPHARPIWTEVGYRAPAASRRCRGTSSRSGATSSGCTSMP